VPEPQAATDASGFAHAVTPVVEAITGLRVNTMKSPLHPLSASSLTLALCCAGWLPAQITIGLAAPTPLQAFASSGGTQQSGVYPAGPLGPATWVTAFAAPAIASFSYSMFQSEFEVSIDCTMTAEVGSYLGPVAGSATAGPNIVDVTLSTAVPTQVLLHLAFVNTTDPGLPTPQFTLDLGNDGLIDNVNGQWSGGAPAQFLQLDSQPTTIRLVAAATVDVVGKVEARATLRLRPTHTTVSTALVEGCGLVSTDVAPIFTATGLHVGGGSNGPSVAVFGFVPQPLLLPPSGLLPCLLYPRVDVVLPVGTRPR
jgi:hypothetical protein